MRVPLLAAALLTIAPCALAAPPPESAFISMGGAGISIEAIDQVVSTAAEGGGHIYHVMPVHTEPGRVLSGACLIGTILPPQEGDILSLPFVTILKRGLVDPLLVEPMGEEAVFAANAWNFLLEGGGEEPPPPGVEPPPNDALGPIEGVLFSGDGSEASLGQVSPASPNQNQTSEFMIGRVAIGVILPESTGSGEDWSNVDFNAQPATSPATVITNRPQEVFNRIVAGANWWAAQGGTAANLTFFYDQRFGVSTTHEPITINAQTPLYNEGVWVSDVLSNMGYNTGDQWARSYSYVNAIRTANNADWGFAVFVADSLNDADGNFPDGFCAFAYLYGPYMVMTYDNDGWGILRMHLVFSHEMAHTFGSPDEYQGAPTNTCTNYGYLNVLNGNSFSCVGGSQTTCLMVNNTQQLCQFTRGHVGWRDSDSDGILDPVDCQLSFPSASLAYYIPPYWGYPQISGQGTVQAAAWPSVTRWPVAINRVAAFYSIDGGAATPATPTDGAFDSDYEWFDIMSSAQADGLHSVALAALDNYGNTGALAAPLQVIIDTTPPPPPNPPVVIVEAPYSSKPGDCTVSWMLGPPDPESGTAGHQVTLRQDPLIHFGHVATQYVPMPSSVHGFIGLALLHAQGYKAYVSAVNSAGVQSPMVVSNLLTIDLTPPMPPTVMSDSGAGTNLLDRLSFSWSAATEDVSGISDYHISIRDELNNWLATGQSTGPVTSYTATGLSLVMGRKYFGHVVALNGAGMAGLPSPESDGILAVTFCPTIGAAKQYSLGSAVGINGVFITSSGADQPGVVFAEQGDRSSGIRTDSTDTISWNQCVEVAGILQLNAQNELCLQNSEVAQMTGTQTISPLGLAGRSLGGGPFGQQPGVTGGTGLNNIGLLVSIWGQVGYVSPGPPYYFVVSDGSGVVDPAGFLGIGVRCGTLTPPTPGTYVKITGICSYEAGWPVVLLRQSGDWN